MHLPDGFLGAELCVATSVTAAGALGYATTRARDELDDRRITLLGPVAATVFAAQMLNFPVAGGTSGHLVGTALATVLLGPWLGMLVVALVLGVQAFAFADGGVMALGANVLNVAVAGALTTAALLEGARAVISRPAGLLAVAGCAAWLSVMAAAMLASAELALSGAAPLASVLGPMLGWHALIGVGEAFITVAVVAAALAARPGLLARQSGPVGRPRRLPAAIAAFAVLAALASPLASSRPDGLNRVAADAGFASAERASGLQAGAPAPGYVLPAVAEEHLATAGAGAVGTLAMFLLASGIALVGRRPAPA